jgi:hypothetical protein
MGFIPDITCHPISNTDSLLIQFYKAMSSSSTDCETLIGSLTCLFSGAMEGLPSYRLKLEDLVSNYSLSMRLRLKRLNDNNQHPTVRFSKRITNDARLLPFLERHRLALSSTDGQTGLRSSVRDALQSLSQRSSYNDENCSLIERPHNGGWEAYDPEDAETTNKRVGIKLKLQDNVYLSQKRGLPSASAENYSTAQVDTSYVTQEPLLHEIRAARSFIQDLQTVGSASGLQVELSRPTCSVQPGKGTYMELEAVATNGHDSTVIKLDTHSEDVQRSMNWWVGNKSTKSAGRLDSNLTSPARISGR